MQIDLKVKWKAGWTPGKLCAFGEDCLIPDRNETVVLIRFVGDSIWT